MAKGRDIGTGTKGLLSYFTRHNTLANLLLAVMIVAGLAAATRIRAQFFPDVIISEVTVSVQWSGAGAEDVDRAIVQVLEPALLTVDGVTDATSRASEGSARITLEFEPGTDLTQAAEDVQSAVDSINTLPEDAEEPAVRRGAWRDRVTDVVITGPVSVDQLGRFADEFTARLFDQGITRTTISGLADPQILVEVPSINLIRHDVTMSEIAAAISAEVDSAPAGDVGGGAARVRTGQEARSATQIAAIVLRQAADGTTLTVGDLATVTRQAADRGRATFVGPNPAITVRVDRSDTGDAIRMQADVQAVADRMLPLLPPDVQIELVRARAEQITGRLNLLLDNALMGLGLVVALLFLFLNARTALWVAAGIPVSLLAAVGIMYGAGLTINMISLFALIITLGIVVDDAIVVGEHADFRARHMGEGAIEASENAAQRMAMPVVASTLTTIIAFAGLVTIGGRFGTLIADIPFTVIAVLLASLVECFLILPNHMAHALRAARAEAWYDWPSRQVNKGLQWLIRVAVRPFTAFVIRARFATMALAVLLLASQAALFISGDLKFRFFNAPEQSSISGNFAMLPGATRDDTLAMMREMQRATDAVSARYAAEHGTNPALFVMTEIGGGTGRGLSSAETKDADLLGGISIELIEPDDRPYSSFTYIADLEEEVRRHPLLEELSFRGGRFGPGGDALSVDLTGADATTLKAAAEALKTALAPYPEVSALEDSLAYDKDELILSLTPQGQALGFAIDTLGRSLRDRLNGIEAASFPDGPRSATVQVELPDSELTADFLDSMLLRAAPGVYVPLADIVTVERRSGFSTIRRENGLRIVTVSGDIAEDDPARAAEVQRALTEDILPKLQEDFGVTTRQSGLAEQQREFLGDATLGLIFCLLGIYMVLAWVFASWTRPVVVMAVIPFGLIGAIYGHDAWGVPLSMFSIVGMIGMTGIIINDSIVLISTIDQYGEKRGLYPAIIDAVADRLRPVLLTTATTVLGLAPLLYERSSQAEFLRPTVITLVYGLGFGMLLVLVLVPAVLAVQGDLARQINAFKRGLRAQAAPRARALLWGGMLAILAWFALTLGWAIPTGALFGPLVGLVPALAAAPAMAAAFGLFIAGAVLVVAACLGLGALLLRPLPQPGE
ncbi:efflux RND transporter permease subunit [Pseudorhodobacter sp. E13]|uniref:efflux RND transporter permease subunit n=1 Tax=Pseudorhodobacter sp. E13 TaxID=2487931 RepID=UPI000F8EF26C|nr:efflux RND transporter permease subunit [Pseudorhodobacter sp. E13]RUS60736.1 efflux RND transporter permease subunit [Pseudorhodobacter sp. E13]